MDKKLKIAHIMELGIYELQQRLINSLGNNEFYREIINRGYALIIADKNKTDMARTFIDEFEEFLKVVEAENDN